MVVTSSGDALHLLRLIRDISLARGELEIRRAKPPLIRLISPYKGRARPLNGSVGNFAEEAVFIGRIRMPLLESSACAA